MKSLFLTRGQVTKTKPIINFPIVKTFLIWKKLKIWSFTIFAKKAKCPNIKPEYLLELESVNAAELGSIVANEFGQVLQWAGVETVIVDNNKMAHSKTVTDAWEKFGINVWPGADKLSGFPMNSPYCMFQDQSVNNTWKNLVGGLYDTFNK